MADPICRWRNATPKTICEIVESLPKTEMTADDFRKQMAKSKWGDGFAKTVYQFACQTALYYIDEDYIYHPRFKVNISEEEADFYLFNWFRNYYVPNPYTRGFEKLDKPIFIVATFEEKLKINPFDNNFEELSKKILKDTVGELDIFKNVINRYSGSLKIENNKINIIPSGERKMEVNADRNDKKAFFENFNNEHNSSYTQNFSQTIYYGVPGSGKSIEINNILKKEITNDKDREFQVCRVVFHPEYTNADFVGQVLPRLKGGDIKYEFKPGPFAKILYRALHNPEKKFFLIIEEINRGNAAAIFGDIFQLLDRIESVNDTETIGSNTFGIGWSKYFIENDYINNYIRSKVEYSDEAYTEEHGNKKISLGENIIFSANTSLRLPPNLSLLATMNTSDQNVFTLDNAFQRRWDMQLIKNECTDKKQMDATITVNNQKISWEDFQQTINSVIGEKSNEGGLSSMEDKRLGCWFVKAENNEIKPEVFANKVLKYLWDDAFKFYHQEIFGGVKNFEELQDSFLKNGFSVFSEACMLQNKIRPVDSKGNSEQTETE